ncbi:MAG: hypothetical protein K0R62_5616 [Nonomuraea muscovyensis]|nr:hypothetical protein [Nonomuraea muscovyensis]
MTGDADRLGAGRYVAPAHLPDGSRTTAHELTTHDGATVNGLLRVIPGATTVAFLMHPRQDFSHHVLVPELLTRGFAVWTQGARSLGNDLTLLHEQALLDMAAGHVFLRDLGFEHVVAIGHSGGATLAAFYFQQAGRAPAARLDSTPGGKPVPLPSAVMPPADGLIMFAPHPGQGALLQRMIDPSLIDETDPLSVAPDLDPYNPANGFAEPPESSTYPPDFVERYRRAQRARIERIDAAAWERVGQGCDRGAPHRCRPPVGRPQPRPQRPALRLSVRTATRPDQLWRPGLRPADHPRSMAVHLVGQRHSRRPRRLRTRRQRSGPPRRTHRRPSLFPR